MTYEITYIGAKWCKACKIVQPQIEDLAKKYGVPVKHIDYDEMEEEEQKDVGKVPTVYLYKNGKQDAKYESNQVVSVNTWLQTNVLLSEGDF
jgi:thiol-disulfide isomerase/thioredoxin